MIKLSREVISLMDMKEDEGINLMCDQVIIIMERIRWGMEKE